MLSNLVKKRKIETDQPSVQKESCIQIPYSYIQSFIQPQDWIQQHYSSTGSVTTEQQYHLF
jgi:hypothetical protein